MRHPLGYPHPARVPAGVLAEQWIGFSAEEIGRRNDHRGWPRFQRPTYPLMDRVPMTRGECARWRAERGWSVTRSSCVGCPFHGNRYWRAVRQHRPDEWAQAVAFDAAIRHGGARGAPLRASRLASSAKRTLSWALGAGRAPGTPVLQRASGPMLGVAWRSGVKEGAQAPFPARRARRPEPNMPNWATPPTPPAPAYTPGPRPSPDRG